MAKFPKSDMKEKLAFNTINALTYFLTVYELISNEIPKFVAKILNKVDFG